MDYRDEAGKDGPGPYYIDGKSLGFGFLDVKTQDVFYGPVTSLLAVRCTEES